MRLPLPLHRFKIPLRLALVVPFVLILVTTITLTDYFSFYNSQKSIQELAQELMEEVGDRVELYLDRYLALPHHINRSNVNAVRFGQLDPRDLNAVEQHLMWQISNGDNISDILYANEQGSFRVADSIDGIQSIWVTDRPDIRKFERYQISETGDRGQLLETGEYPPNWDIRQRPWYQLAKQKQQPTWSSVYTLGDGTDLTINASVPVRDPTTQEFIGAFAVNLHLSRFNDFLKPLKLGRSGIVFVVGTDGFLIASSTDELPFIQFDKCRSDRTLCEGNFQRLLATESQHPLIRAASRHFRAKIKDWSQIERLQKWQFTEKGQTYFAQVQPYNDEYGLNWAIVTVVPRSELMQAINANNRNTLWVTGLAVMGAIAIGISIANWIARPLLALSQTSAAMAAGDLNRQLSEQLPLRELVRMARSFNQMAAQLREAFDRIETNLRESEAKYAKIFRSSPDPITITSLEDGRLIDANNSFLELAGYTYEEAIARTVSELNLVVHPQEAKAITQQLREMGMVKNQEFHWRTKSGEIKVSLVSCEIIQLEGQPYALTVSKEIGELKQVEHALRESEQRFREIAQTISQLFFLRSATTGKFIYVSPAYEKIWGRSCESLYRDPQSWVETIHPDDRGFVTQSISRQIAGHSVEREYRIIRPDGEIRWILAQINPARDEAGNLVHFIGFATDITERKVLALALQDSESKLSEIINSPIASIIRIRVFANREWEIDYLSLGCEAVFGYTRQEFLENKSIWMERIVPVDLETVIFPLYDEIFAEKTTGLEYQFYHKDGTLRWLSARFTARYDRAGDCWFVNQFAIDISDRKRAEAALQQSEQQYRRIVETANEGIWVIDESGFTRFVNPKMAELLGYTVDEMLDRPLLSFMEEAEQAIAIEKLERRRQGIREQHDFKFCRKDGCELWVLLSTTPITDRTGHYIGALAMVTDISDRKRAEIALEEQAKREQLLNQVIQAIHQSLDLPTIFSTATAGIAQLLGLDRAVIVRYLPERRLWVHISAYRKDPGLPDDSGQKIPDEGNPVADRLKQGQVVSIENTNTLDDPINQELANDRSGAWLLVPIGVNGTVWGSLSLWNRTPISWQDREIQLARRVVEPLGIAIHQANLYQQSQQAEAALRESETRYRGIVEDQTELIARLKPDGTLTFVNAAYCRYFQRSPEELMGHSYQPVVVEEDREYVAQLVNSLSRENPLITIENRVIVGDEIRWTQWINRMIFNQQGECIEIQAVGRDISDLKQAEEALKQSELTLRSFFNSASMLMGIVELYPDDILHITDNLTTAKFFGTTPAAMENRLASEIGVPQSYLDMWLSYYREADRTGTPVCFEYAHPTPEGEKWLSVCVCQILSSPSGRSRFSYIAEDISDRKQAEAALRGSERKFRGVFDTIAAGICLVAITGGCFDANAALCQILGYSQAELLSLRWQDLVYLDDQAEELKLIEQIYRGAQQSAQLEQRFVRKDGTIVWGLLSISLMRGLQGNPLYLIAQITDISDRKRAEQELLETKNKLSEALLFAQMGYYELDLKQQILTLTDEWYALVKTTAEAENGYQISFKEARRRFQPAESGEKSDRDMARVLASFDRDRVFYSTTPFVTTEGNQIWLQSRFKLLRDENNCPEKLVGISINITDRKKAEEELQKAKEAAEAANQAKSEFLANMSHEIRTPMNAILGFSDVLKGIVTDPQQLSYLETIASSGQTLMALINDILDLSKIEAGKLELSYEPILLRALIRDIQQIFAPKAEAKHLFIFVNIADTVPDAIVFDPVRLRQILFNVVGNALKFTERGSVTIHANAYETTENSARHIQLELAVSDTGIGIAPEEQKRIFEAFIQSDGKTTRKYGGTGLGLAITRRLTQILGGTVQLTSSPNQGSTFTFTFPEVEIASTGSKSVVSLELYEHLDRFQAATILVVDDVHSNLDLMAGYFANTHHRLLLAREGEEAIAIAIAHQPNLILLDLWMPEFSGLEVAKFLKQHKQTHHIPIIIVTASSRSMDEEAVREFCQGFLRKPFTRSQLISQLQKVLPLDEHHSALEEQPQATFSEEMTELTDPEVFAKWPELAEKLRQEEESGWPLLCETMKRRDLQKFSDRLHAWGVQYQCQALLDYATTLQTQLATFDWECLPLTLKTFPELRRKLL